MESAFQPFTAHQPFPVHTYLFDNADFSINENQKSGFADLYNTACLKAQKWFLGVGGAKKIILFMKFFL